MVGLSRYCQTAEMDECLANRLLVYAIYLACSGTEEPTEEAILSLFGWLAYEIDASISAEVFAG